MAETEVEDILREIRERVVSQERAGRNTAMRAEATNGAGEAAQLPRPKETEALAEQSLALIQSYLTTTARTWDRLPPLVSHRSGVMARLELWLKRRLKTATRWFTWEQVNFNAAVHHALRDLLQTLSAHEQERGELRARIEVEAETRQIEFGQHQTELAARDAEIETLRITTEALRRRMETQAIQFDSSLAGLAVELRESVERLQEEQRVCFKQLALETSEGAVLEDRARRKAETLLQELTRRVELLEKR
jgi:hypothetical protein